MHGRDLPVRLTVVGRVREIAERAGIAPAQVARRRWHGLPAPEGGRH
ncbi:hypothetical protein [Streptomyces mirabilis]